MRRLPPFRYLRKTTLLILVVFFCFIVHWIWTLIVAEESADEFSKIKLEKPRYSVVCRNIVGGSPFGVDSVFPLHTRLYYFSEVPHMAWSVPDRRIRHIWYHGGDTVLSVRCTLADSTCESSISPQQLFPGEWSVDAVEGRRLLSSRQFKVESSRE